ncbi:MAG: DNA topoisomerase IB [Erythrobacter sp.]|jgi:DNA topoisomerase-1|nr:DNA topoisomerase IB [Erythrobacter sp.]
MSRLALTNFEEPGVTRRRIGKRFGYFTAQGERITDEEEIARFDAIALPPAYIDCWFNPDPNGHIQATGIDARGRKQYRYHPRFRERREARKFELCGRFGGQLPALRKAVREDLARRGFCKEKAVACTLALLDLGAMRIGNEHYQKNNRTHGATTLLKRHVKVRGKTVRLRYRGKGGKLREVSISDRSLARLVRRMHDLPGQRLFQYRDEEGEWRAIGSSDVNAFIHEVAGEKFSAKDFRTWHASALALDFLARTDGPTTLKSLCEHVAEHLGNTPATTRKSYIHPAVIALAESGGGAEAIHGVRRTQSMSRAERALLRVLGAA